MSTPTETETALARRFILEINMDDDDTPDWGAVYGMTAFMYKITPNIEDDADYDGEGWGDANKTGQDWEVTASFKRKQDPDNTSFSPVHERIRQHSVGYGDANKTRLRFYDRNGLPEAYQGKAVPTWEPQNDEARDQDIVEVTWAGSGPLTAITNPATP